ncbi:MAG TPA: DUF1573 domain-containing protein [Pirellulales bacterium]|nr:DUF1573 domain-containing protein [Pirellulales bacterium]
MLRTLIHKNIQMPQRLSGKCRTTGLGVQVPRAGFAAIAGLATLLLSLVFATIGHAQDPQEWAVKMFDATKFDFGPVARGAKSQHRFKIKNIYEQDVHIAGVRSSCNCTAPQVTKSDLSTWETGEIVAEFNTRQFIGQKSAVVTVTFDKPRYAEVQLHVTGFIRSDVVLQPGEINFGTVDVGTSHEERVQISYAGREDWSLTDVRSADPNLRLQLVDMGRGRGQKAYELVVRLSRNAPVGYIKDQVTLLTNDVQNPEIPIDVEGRVVSEIAISPATVFMGVVQPGQVVSKQLIVRGKRPFRIVGIKCDDASFALEIDDEPRVVHKLSVIFTAGEHEGKVSQQIGLETDGGSTPTLTAYAQVVGSSGQPTPAKRREKGEPMKKRADKDEVDAVLHLNVEPDPEEQ